MTISQLNSPQGPEHNLSADSHNVEEAGKDKSPKHPSVIDDLMESTSAAAAAGPVVSEDEARNHRNPKPQSAPHIHSPPLASLKLPLSNYYISSSDQPLDLSKKSTKPAHRHRSLSSSKGLTNGHSAFPSSLQSLQLRFGGDFPIDTPKKPSSSIPLQSSIVQGKSFLRPPVPPTGNHAQSHDFNHKSRFPSKSDKSSDAIRSSSPLQKAELSDSDDVGSEHGGSKYTIHRCSCLKSFSTLYTMSVHLQDTGHMPKMSKSQSVMDYPKLVRGQDMWLNQESEQTRRILRCMQCGESFKSLPMLTVHMMQTQHYAKIVSSDHGRRSHKCSAYCEKELDRECIFKCKVCHDTFTDMEGLANHMIVSGHHKKQVLHTGAAYPVADFGIRSSSRSRKRFYSEDGGGGGAAATVASLLDFKRKCLSYGPNGYRSNSMSDSMAASGKVADSLITCENCGQRIDMEMFVDHVRLCLKQKSEVIDALKQKLTSEEHARIRNASSYRQIPRVKQEFKVTSRNKHHPPSFHNDPKRGLPRSLSPREQAKKDAIRALKKLHRIKKEHLLNGKDVYEIMESMYKKTFDDIKQETIQTSETKSQKDKTVLPQHVKATKLDSALTASHLTTLFSSRESVEQVPLKQSVASENRSKENGFSLLKKDMINSRDIDQTDSILKETSETSLSKTSVSKKSVEGNELSCDPGLKVRQETESLGVVTSQDDPSLCSQTDLGHTKTCENQASEHDRNSSPSLVPMETDNENGLVVTDRSIKDSVKGAETTDDATNSLAKRVEMDCDSKCDISSEVSRTSDDEGATQSGLKSLDCDQIKLKRETNSPESVDVGNTDKIVRQSGECGSESSGGGQQSVDKSSDVPVLVSSSSVADVSDFSDDLRSGDSQLRSGDSQLKRKKCFSDNPISNELQSISKSNSSDILKSCDSQSINKGRSPDNCKSPDSDSIKVCSSDVRSSDSQLNYKKCSTDSEHVKSCSPDNLKSSDSKSLSIDSVQSCDSQSVSLKSSTESLKSSYLEHVKLESSDAQPNGKRYSANSDLQLFGEKCSTANLETSDSQPKNKSCSSANNSSVSEHQLGDIFKSNSNTVDPHCNGVKSTKAKTKDSFNKAADGKTESKTEYKSTLSVAYSEDGVKSKRKNSPVFTNSVNDSEHNGHKDKVCDKQKMLEPDHKDTDHVKTTNNVDVSSRKLMDIIDPDSSDTTANSNSALKAMESFIRRSFTSTFDHHRSNIASMMSPVNKLCVPLQSTSVTSNSDGSLHYFSKLKKGFSFDPATHNGDRRAVLENGALSSDNEKSTKCAKVKSSSHRLAASSKRETKDSSEDQKKSWSPMSVKSEKDTPSPQTLPRADDDQESLINKYLCVEGQNSTGRGSALDSLSSFVYGQPMTSEHPLDSLQKLLTRTEIPQMLKPCSESALRRMYSTSPDDDVTKPLNLSLKSSLHCSGGDDDGNDQMDGFEDTGSLDDGAGSPGGGDGDLSEYKCAACSRQFASKGSYRYHLSRCHLSSVKMYGIKEAFNMSPYVYLPLDHTAKFSKYYEMAQELANKGK
ncbi:uncharacterized protein LOC121389413 isoform X2 [Gigantopelta aegis]|nr:uncharacterized protein LOC121389413 isoform X2 [Gigantopelta aegis]